MLCADSVDKLRTFDFEFDCREPHVPLLTLDNFIRMEKPDEIIKGLEHGTNRRKEEIINLKNELERLKDRLKVVELEGQSVNIAFTQHTHDKLNEALRECEVEEDQQWNIRCQQQQSIDIRMEHMHKEAARFHRASEALETLFEECHLLNNQQEQQTHALYVDISIAVQERQEVNQANAETEEQLRRSSDVRTRLDAALRCLDTRINVLKHRISDVNMAIVQWNERDSLKLHEDLVHTRTLLQVNLAQHRQKIQTFEDQIRVQEQASHGFLEEIGMTYEGLLCLVAQQSQETRAARIHYEQSQEQTQELEAAIQQCAQEIADDVHVIEQLAEQCHQAHGELERLHEIHNTEASSFALAQQQHEHVMNDWKEQQGDVHARMQAAMQQASTMTLEHIGGLQAKKQRLDDYWAQLQPHEPSKRFQPLIDQLQKQLRDEWLQTLSEIEAKREAMQQRVKEQAAARAEQRLHLAQQRRADQAKLYLFAERDTQHKPALNPLPNSRIFEGVSVVDVASASAIPNVESLGSVSITVKRANKNATPANPAHTEMEKKNQGEGAEVKRTLQHHHAMPSSSFLRKQTNTHAPHGAVSHRGRYRLSHRTHEDLLSSLQEAIAKSATGTAPFVLDSHIENSPRETSLKTKLQRAYSELNDEEIVVSTSRHSPVRALDFTSTAYPLSRVRKDDLARPSREFSTSDVVATAATTDSEVKTWLKEREQQTDFNPATLISAREPQQESSTRENMLSLASTREQLEHRLNEAVSRSLKQQQPHHINDSFSSMSHTTADSSIGGKFHINLPRASSLHSPAGLSELKHTPLDPKGLALSARVESSYSLPDRRNKRRSMTLSEILPQNVSRIAVSVTPTTTIGSVAHDFANTTMKKVSKRAKTIELENIVGGEKPSHKLEQSPKYDARKTVRLTTSHLDHSTSSSKSAPAFRRAEARRRAAEKLDLVIASLMLGQDRA